MFFKETLIVFPWTTGYKQLSTCENVRKGTFRIGQLMFNTKFQIPGLIVAKQFQADIFTMDGICVELSTKLDGFTANYRDGLMCGHDFARSVTDVAIQARGFMAHSSCNMRLTHCDKTGCPAKKVAGDHVHEETERKYQEFLDNYDKK